jgi:hypothetical protein
MGRGGEVRREEGDRWEGRREGGRKRRQVEKGRSEMFGLLV